LLIARSVAAAGTAHVVFWLVGGVAAAAQTAPPALVGESQRDAQREDPTRFVRSVLEEGGDVAAALDLVPSQDPGPMQSVRAGGQTFLVSAQAVTVQSSGGTSSLAGPQPRLYEVTIHPGTGYVERFLVSPGGRGKPRPLLVVFHKFGVSHYDVLYNTDFFREAQRRGWHCVAPLGASGVHFSSLESQVNTEAVLNWMAANFQVNPKRVYGVGFSMGGGAALNYAARHLDPAGLMFAAVVDHTGVVDLNDAYANEPNARFIFDFWYGNGSAGSADPWKMARSSVIRVDPSTSQVDASSDLGRNLMHLTTRIVRATNDPVAYLMDQNDALWSHLQSLGAGSAQHVLYVLPYTGHSWDLLDEVATCDWLAAQRLSIPRAGNTLADRDGTYFYFDVVQSAAGAFTPFVWEADSSANSLSISGTANLARLSVDTPAAGLDVDSTLSVDIATADGNADEIVLRRWPSYPSNVLRDGIATSSWSYDPQTRWLTLSEFDGAPHEWTVVP
jgi:acetyl esterase/lipase